MKKHLKTALVLGLVFLTTFFFFGCSETKNGTAGGKTGHTAVEESGSYTSKDEVALYIHTYNKLPNNFITKEKAEKLGWNSKEGNLEEVAKGKSIGGSHFGNYDGKLPEKKGRNWKECDINYTGGRRNAERIIYSNDGLIYYTGDHYKNFEPLY
ncbi:MAG: ribonuclease domain-containing protein [Eubacterium sp.]